MFNGNKLFILNSAREAFGHSGHNLRVGESAGLI
jgi:hypothetical protein